MSAIDVVSLEAIVKNNPQRRKALKRHLKTEQEHGTDKCFYCYDFAVANGMLVGPPTA